MTSRIDKKVIRGVIYKCCGRCHEYHPESEFNLSAKSYDHLQGYCRSCNIAYCRDWHKEYDRKSGRE